MGPSELVSLYLYGIRLQNQYGTEMTNEDITTFIKSAQEQVENLLDIKLFKQVYEENSSFYVNDLIKWGFIQTSYPVMKPLAMDGYLGGVLQVEYPEEWLVSKTSGDDKGWSRQMFVVAYQNALINQAGLTFNTISSIGLLGYSNVPYYWKLRYITGFTRIPNDILTVIGKIASIFIFHQMGDIIIGAGIANMSLSIDGLSQSIGTTNSATNAGYGARIENYIKDLKIEIPRLKSFYKDITFTVC